MTKPFRHVPRRYAHMTEPQKIAYTAFLKEMLQGFHTCSTSVLFKDGYLTKKTFALRFSEDLARQEMGALDSESSPESCDLDRMLTACFAKKFNADAVVMTCEVWVSHQKPPVEEKLMRASEDPNRQEAIVTVLKTRDGKVFMLMSIFARDDLNRICALDDKDMVEEAEAYIIPNWDPPPPEIATHPRYKAIQEALVMSPFKLEPQDEATN